MILLITGLFSGIGSPAFSQMPASLEQEYIQFHSSLYDALSVLGEENETDAVAKLNELKPQLMQSAESLSEKLARLPDLSAEEEDVWMQRMMEKREFKDLMALLSDQSYMQKIENNQGLQREFEELMSIMDLGSGAENEEAVMSGSQVCSFTLGSGSPLSGSYEVQASEDEAFAYMDTENDQFVIEIHGENYIDVMLIIEKPVTGRHFFTMEMQVAIDVSNNEGEDYFGFDNYQEEGGGYIQIDRLDDIGGMVSGSFSGRFNDGSTNEDRPVQIDGSFTVTRM